MGGVDGLVFVWQVFDMEDMKDSKFEGDRIVRSSLYKCPVLLPLMSGQVRNVRFLFEG